MGDIVSNGPTHGQSWGILFHKPDPHGSKILPLSSLDGVNSAIAGKDPLFLDLHTRFMIFGERRDLDTALRLVKGVKYSSRVSRVCTKDSIAVEEHRHTSGATQLRIILLTAQVLVDLVESRVHDGWDLVVHLLDLLVV
jgi:hypothetical protein